MSGTTTNPNPPTDAPTGDTAQPGTDGATGTTATGTGTSTEGEGTGAGDGTEAPVRLPDDHPLVTAYARVRDELATARSDAQARQAEVDTMTEQLAQADAAVEGIPATVAGHLRDHLVRVHGITAEDRDLLLTATDPDTLIRQVDRLVERKKARTGVVPTQGTGDPGTRLSSYDIGAERARARYGTAKQ